MLSQGFLRSSAFLGCLYAGAIAVPAYPPRRNQNLTRLQSIAIDTQATVALTTQDLLDNDISIYLGQDRTLAQLKWLATDTIATTKATCWELPTLTEETLAFLQYTSGSTGMPKGVKVSHLNLLNNEQMIQHAFGHTSESIIVGWLPLFHDMGLIGNVLQPLYLGVPCIFMAPITTFLQTPFYWLQAISRYRATTSGGPNFAYDLCMRSTTPEQRSQLDLSSWQLAFNGSETVRAETLLAFAGTFESCGFKPEAFYPCYGMAEATLFISGGAKTKYPQVLGVDDLALGQNQVSITQPDRPGYKVIVGVGHPWLDQSLQIVSPDTRQICAEDRVGEIWVAGTNIAGGTYVPLDPTYPPERLAFSIQDAKIQVLVTETDLASALPSSTYEIVYLDRDRTDIAQQSVDNLVCPAKGENLVYIIYTSGSTGIPKGVAMQHQSLINLITWQIQNVTAPSSARTAQFASLSFDVSVQETFATWCGGGTLVLVPEETRRDATILLQFLTDAAIKRFFAPYVVLQQLAEVAIEPDQVPKGLQDLITAGEQLCITPAIARFFERLEHCTLWNHYGPTETHLATAYTLTGNPSRWVTT